MSIWSQFSGKVDTHRLEGVARGRDEEDAAVDAGVGDEALAHGGKLLAEVRRVLVLDVLDDRLPAVVVVDEVAVAGRVNDVELEADAVLNDGFDQHRSADCGRLGRRTGPRKVMARAPEFGPPPFYSPWLLTWISVVERAPMSGSVRPFESTRCDAKRVLTRVDLPRPVWPVGQRHASDLLPGLPPLSSLSSRLVSHISTRTHQRP